MDKTRPPVILTSFCLHYLLWLRTLAIGGQVTATAITYSTLAIPFPTLAFTLVILALTVFTLFSWWQVKSGHPVSESFFFIQLLADVVAISVLLYFTGGSANPFVSLLLLPVTVAAATLVTGHRLLIAAAAAIAYSLLMFVHVPDPQWDHAGDGFTLHRWGMWVGFLLSAGLVVYFVARIGSALREHDQALAQAREQALQGDQLAALGALAAGTAHELGTPLSTMAILSNEISRDHGEDPELRRKIAILRDQITCCKAILSRLAERAGQARADEGRKVTVANFLEELLSEWRSLRPNVKLSVSWDGPRPGPQIIADRTLSQAIVNILNNAADASAHSVTVQAHWDADALQIDVHDRGGGIPSTLRDQLGKPFVTNKPPGKGLGLGLYLARAPHLTAWAAPCN